MLYIINLYNITCQLYLNKPGEVNMYCNGWLRVVTRLQGPLPPSLRSAVGVPHSPNLTEVKGCRDCYSCPFKSAFGTESMVRRVQSGSRGASWKVLAQSTRQMETFAEKGGQLGRYPRRGPLNFLAYCQFAHPLSLAHLLVGSFGRYLLFSGLASIIFIIIFSLATIPASVPIPLYGWSGILSCKAEHVTQA